MKTVRDMLRQKGPEVWSVPPDATVYEALERMEEKNVGALLVCRGEEIFGIFSERDYSRKMILKGRTSRETPVREIMTRQVIFVGPDQSVEECMALMTDRRVRHLLVMEDERCAGIVSIGDVVKAVISEKQFVIEQLVRYIQGQT